MKKTTILSTLAVLLLGSMGAVNASTTIYGTSGLIETPDDTILAPASVSATANFITNFNDSSSNILTYGGAVGILPKFEVSAVGIDSDASGVNTQLVANAKYKILSETFATPSITVGAVDLGKQLNTFSGGGIADPSAYVVFGKNLTNVAEGILGNVSMPLRGTVGFGTGLYKGAFVGLKWYTTPKLNFMFEYLSNGLRQKTTFNAAVKYNVYGGLSVNAGTLGCESLYVGANYTLGGF